MRYSTYYYEVQKKWMVFDNQTGCLVAGTESESQEICDKKTEKYNQEKIKHDLLQQIFDLAQQYIKTEHLPGFSLQVFIGTPGEPNKYNVKTIGGADLVDFLNTMAIIFERNPKVAAALALANTLNITIAGYPEKFAKAYKELVQGNMNGVMDTRAADDILKNIKGLGKDE